jgi:hypothetical protein
MPSAQEIALASDVGNDWYAIGFAEGCQFMLAQFWDEIETAGSYPRLAEAVQMTKRFCEGEHPAPTIQTNRGPRAYWKQEAEWIAGRFRCSFKRMEAYPEPRPNRSEPFEPKANATPKRGRKRKKKRKTRCDKGKKRGPRKSKDGESPKIGRGRPRRTAAITTVAAEG